MIEDVKMNELFRIYAHNFPLFHFMWVVFMSRMIKGAVKGNWIKFRLNNKFFDAEFKLTIKRKPTHSDKEMLKEYYGLDLDEIAEALR